MESELKLIPAKSRRQTMEWSLVLASQNIEHSIEQQTSECPWSLRVNSSDYERAIVSLRAYRAENARWPLHQTLPWKDFVFDWSCMGWVILVCFFYWIQTRSHFVENAGILDGGAFAHGEWWRLFTATNLHADLGHLASNIAIGILLLGLTMGAYGTGLGFLGAYCAGALGNLLTVTLHSKGFAGLGASGVVMGALGLLTVHSIHLRNVRFFLVGIGAGTMLFVLLGTAPETDAFAHLGGFVAGILIGILLDTTKLVESKLANTLSSLIAVGLLLLTWWLALTNHQSSP